MNRLFASATLKLTGWYIAILTIISVMFSVLLYQISVGEVQRRLDNYGKQTIDLSLPATLRGMTGATIRSHELNNAKTSIIIVLVYTNVVVIFIGGVGSYFLARRTLQPVEEAHHRQTRFVSDASHELRTPLASMTTELEVALRDPSLTKAEMRELLASNLEEVQRLTKLSTTLLALSSDNTEALRFAAFDITEATQRVIDRVATKRTISLTATTKRRAIGHPESIEELITILVDNACKYSPADTPITITIDENHGKIVFTISNEGEGIEPQHLPHIFERFYRADAARSGNSGHGLGLALAHQISTLHKADLGVTSTPNGTTNFSFSLQSIGKNKK